MDKKNLNPQEILRFDELMKMDDELLKKIDIDYQKIIKFKGSGAELKKKIEEKLKEYKEGLEKMSNFYIQHLGGKINFDEIKKVILGRENK